MAADGSNSVGGWDPLLTPTEAAELLRCSPRTLERWRNLRIGPAWVRMHGGYKVRYRQSVISTFVLACEVNGPDHTDAAENGPDAHTSLT